MNCPACGQPQATTTSTRHTDDCTISRKRKCALCGHKWASLEIALDFKAGHHVRNGDHYAPHFHIKWPYVDAIKAAITNV